MSVNRVHNNIGSKFVAILLVAIMVLSAVPLVGDSFFSAADPEDEGTPGTEIPEYVHTITYYESKEKMDSDTGGVPFTYSGIPSTEYNPQFVSEFSSWSQWTKTENVTLGSSSTVDVRDYVIKFSFNARSGATVDLSSWGIPVGTTVTCKDAKGTGAAYLLSSKGQFDPVTGIVSYETSWSISNPLLYAEVTISSLSLSISNSSLNVSVPYVFVGWKETESSSIIYPGDVVNPETKKLYAVWDTVDVFISSSNVSVTPSSGSTIQNNSPAKPTATISGDNYSVYCNASNAGDYTPIRTGSIGEPMFTRLYNLDGNNLPASIYSGTYRSPDFNNPNVALEKKTTKIVTITSTRNCYGDVIIDNVLLNCSSGGSHGDTGNGIFANGHRLIIGTNCDATTGYKLQLFGGSQNKDVSNIIERNKPVVSLDEDLNGFHVDIGTYLIVHSGIYSNIVGGGQDGAVGSNSVPLSTYVVIKNAIVTDTVVGGGTNDTGKYTGRVYATGSTGDSSSNGFKQGGTFIYATGLKMTADSWQEKQLDGTRNLSKYARTESSILEGGSSRTDVEGSTHVFLSGDSDLWDAQAGGRRGRTSADFAYMEISGNAIVRHIACGSITDGNYESNVGDKDCIGGARLVMYDNSKVGMLVGAGYDTWYSPTYRSMTKGNISVEVKGGTVGFVYGGGFRGSVGTPNDSSKLSIDVIISGGAVLHDVFGAGRGGVDKITHNSDDEGLQDSTSDPNHTPSRKNSTGSSFVYGNVNVYVSGGKIYGDVYGGGESVPILYSVPYGADESVSGFDVNTNLVATVTGSTHVTVSGNAEIFGNVYGAGKGITINNYGTDSVFVPGTVYDGNYTQMFVFKKDANNTPGWINWFSGAGTPTYVGVVKEKDQQGKETEKYNLISTYLEYAKVTGNSGVTVSGGTIHQDVYGGGAYGKVTGDTTVSISGGKIEGNVYGGGVGRTGVTAVGGDRTITVKEAAIDGSIYGGTAYGNDGTSNSSGAYDGNTRIYVESGDIEGSIFGGGFKGTSYCNTGIYLGYAILETGPVKLTSEKASGKPIIIGQSVYLGGDVGELGTDDVPYDKALVMGSGTMHIYGAYCDISLHGSLMGSGNACLTKGRTTITIEMVDNPVPMEAIHRAKDVILVESTLVLNGRSTVDRSAADSLYTLFNIENLVLKDMSSITLNNPVENIGSFSSLNKDGKNTTVSAPSNRLTVGSGNSLVIRTINETIFNYGTVSGYTILTINNSQGNFGGYVLGNASSSGGFVVMSKGSYVPADTTLVSDTCKCWFISGTFSSSLAVSLPYTDGGTVSETASFNLAKLLPDSLIRYTGGTFTASNRSMYNMVQTPGDVGDFSLEVGYIPADEEGQHVPKNGVLYFDEPQYLVGAYTTTSVAGIIKGNDVKNPVIHVQVQGRFVDESQYIGYCTIYLQEVLEITYDISANEKGTTYVLTNSIQLTVEIYTEGSSDKPGNSEITIGTVNGEGSADIMIPSKLPDHEVRFIRVETQVQSGTILKAEAVKNLNNTPGWTTMNGSKVLYPSGTGSAKSGEVLGVLNGGYNARVSFSVSNFTGVSETYKVYLQLYQGGQAVGDEFYVEITVDSLPNVVVAFVDSNQDSRVVEEYPYGTFLNDSICPPTLDNFIGWYYDANFTTAYSFSTPLAIINEVDDGHIIPLTLYARYMWVVTFDNQDGTSSKLYIAENDEGALITEPNKKPQRYGYDFDNWYMDTKCLEPWNFSTMKIHGSITLYAGWKGYPIEVVFSYGDNKTLEYSPTVNFGGVFGVPDIRESKDKGYDVSILAKAQSDLEQTDFMKDGKKFIRWQIVVSETLSLPIYDDTVVDRFTSDGGNPPKYHVELTAVVSNLALQVRLNTNTPDLTAEIAAPSLFLVFPDVDDLNASEWTFRYSLSDATRSGWTLVGWSTDKDATPTSEGCIGSGTPIVDTYDSAGWKDKLSNVEDPYTIDYYAVWKQIPYTISIMPPTNGTIDAFYNGTAGEKFTAYYGDRISLRFTPDTGYEFAKWIVSGEGTIHDSDIGNPNTTLVVVGDCAVYGSTIGPQIVQLYAEFNGGTKFPVDEGDSDILPVPGIFLRNVVDGSLTLMHAVEFIDGRGCYRYQAIADTGVYTMCLVGDNGKLYEFGDIIVSTTRNSAELKVLTVRNDVDDPDGGILDYSQYIPYDGSFNVVVGAGNSYELTYRFDGEQETTPLGSSSTPIDSDRNMSRDSPAGSRKGIILEGNVHAATYSVDYTLVFPSDAEGTQYSVPAGAPTDVRYGTLLSTIFLLDDFPADETKRGLVVVDGSGSSLIDGKYAIVAWYLGFDQGTRIFSNPISATQRFDSTLLNDSESFHLYAKIIDITKEYVVPIHEIVMNTEGEYDRDTGYTVTAHAVTTQDESIPLAEKKYTGTYILGDYSDFPRTVAVYYVDTSDPVPNPELSFNGREMTFTVRFGQEIRITYERPSVNATFDFDNGTTPSVQRVYFEQVIGMPAVPDKSNYEFVGWKVENGSGTVFTETVGTETVYRYTVSATDCQGSGPRFTALYEPIHAYTLTFVTEHGVFSNGSSRISYTVGVDEALFSYFSANEDALKNSDSGPYEFLGWNRNKENVMPSNDLSYTATWRPQNFTLEVEFDKKTTDISVTVDKDYHDYTGGETIPYYTNVTLTIKFVENYTLGNCITAPADLGSKPEDMRNGREYTWSFFILQNTEITISAVYSGVSVHFYVNGVLDSTVAADKYQDFKFDPFQREGYPEGIWYYNESCSCECAKCDCADKDEEEGCGCGMVKIGEDGKYVIPTIYETTKVYTKVAPYTYTVKYVDGSDELGSQDMVYDTESILGGFTTPTKAGHIFLGWTYNSVFYVPNDTVKNLTSVNEGVITFTAVWAQVDGYSGTYDGSAHYGQITTAYGTPYYGRTSLTTSNYMTSGSTDYVRYTDVVNASVYYYLVVESQVTSKTMILTGSFNVEITKRDVTFTSFGATKMYDGTPLVNHTDPTNVGLIAADQVTFNFTGSVTGNAEMTESETAHNTFTVAWKVPSKANNYNISYVYGNLTVTPLSGEITVTPSTYEKVYGDAPFAIGATSNVPDTTLIFSTEDTGTISLTEDGTVTILAAGSATVSVSLKYSDGRVLDTVSVPVTISKKKLTVDYDSTYLDPGISKQYDGTNKVMRTLNFSLVGVEAADVSAVQFMTSCTYDSVNASDSVILISVACNLSGEKASNYTVDDIKVNGRITPRTVTITTDGATRVYDRSKALENPDVTVDCGGISSPFEFVNATGRQMNVGESDNTVAYQFKAGTVTSNYNVVIVLGKLTVTTLYLDVPEPHSVPYDAGNTIYATNAFPSSSYYRVEGSGSAVTDEGYDATLILVDKNNTSWRLGGEVYTTNDQTVKWYIGQVSIEKGDISLWVKDGEDLKEFEGGEYNGTAIKPLVVVQKTTGEGTATLVEGTHYIVTYGKNVNAGYGTVTVQGKGGYLGNIELSFKISKKPVTVDIQDTVAQYDGEKHSVNFEVNGLVAGDDTSVITLVAKYDGVMDTGKSEIGEYEVVLEDIDSTNYYMGKGKGGTSKLTIRPANILVVSKSAITSITAVTELTCHEYMVFGYYGDDFSSDFDVVFTGVETGIGSTANTFTVTPKTESAALYDVILETGTLTIIKSGYSSIVVSNTLIGI